MIQNMDEEDVVAASAIAQVKRGRGRPKNTKNGTTNLHGLPEATEAAQGPLLDNNWEGEEEEVVVNEEPETPKSIVSELAALSSLVPKRGRGRPKKSLDAMTTTVMEGEAAAVAVQCEHSSEDDEVRRVDVHKAAVHKVAPAYSKGGTKHSDRSLNERTTGGKINETSSHNDSEGVYKVTLSSLEGKIGHPHQQFKAQDNVIGALAFGSTSANLELPRRGRGRPRKTVAQQGLDALAAPKRPFDGLRSVERQEDEDVVAPVNRPELLSSPTIIPESDAAVANNAKKRKAVAGWSERFQRTIFQDRSGPSSQILGLEITQKDATHKAADQHDGNTATTDNYAINLGRQSRIDVPTLDSNPAGHWMEDTSARTPFHGSPTNTHLTLPSEVPVLEAEQQQQQQSIVEDCNLDSGLQDSMLPPLHVPASSLYAMTPEIGSNFTSSVGTTVAPVATMVAQQ